MNHSPRPQDAADGLFEYVSEPRRSTGPVPDRFGSRTEMAWNSSRRTSTGTEFDFLRDRRSASHLLAVARRRLAVHRSRSRRGQVSCSEMSFTALPSPRRDFLFHDVAIAPGFDSNHDNLLDPSGRRTGTCFKVWQRSESRRNQHSRRNADPHRTAGHHVDRPPQRRQHAVHRGSRATVTVLGQARLHPGATAAPASWATWCSIRDLVSGCLPGTGSEQIAGQQSTSSADRVRPTSPTPIPTGRSTNGFLTATDGRAAVESDRFHERRAPRWYGQQPD